MLEKHSFGNAFAKLLTLNLVLTVTAVLLVLPFTWMILTSLKLIEEIGADSWLPEVCQWHNYKDVFSTKGIFFGRWYWNTIFVSCWITFLQVFTSSLAAFSFSRLQWKGRDQVFFLYLATMMLPGLVMMVPNYQNMVLLELVDSYTGLILPAAFSAFGTFMMRQFMMNIPKSLDEAAEIDGATKWQLFWDVVLPLGDQVAALLGCGAAAGPPGAGDADDLHLHRQLQQPLLAAGFDEDARQVHPADRHALVSGLAGAADPSIDGGGHDERRSDDHRLRPAAETAGQGNHARRSERLKPVASGLRRKPFSAAFFMFF